MKFRKIILYDLKTEPLEKEFIGKLKKFSNSVEVVFAKKEYYRQLKLKHLNRVDALITRLFDYYSDELFLKSSLKYIGAMHTDISHFNLDTLKKKKIALTNVPNYATEAVAELTISALLNISRKTHDAMNFVKSGGWGFEKFLGWELRGKTLGIIGLGEIGKRVAEIAEIFEMKILYFSKQKHLDLDRYKFLKLEELLKQSDVISLHCSLNNETKNILNKHRFNIIKAGAVLLNSARSELVNLDVCYDLCRKKKIYAWFEAIEDEEIREKFVKLKNVYLTPHFGWMTREAQERLKNITIDNIDFYLTGKMHNRII